jgi:hypothetical protein
MTVKVTRDAINLREKLSELDKPAGIAGTEILRADTPQEVFNYIGAGRRNLIINGAMQIWQRGTTATINSSNSNVYVSADRWMSIYDSPSTAVATVEQSTDVPEGFKYSLKQTTTTTGTVALNAFRYIIEGYDHMRLLGQFVTASFWFKASVAGRYSYNHHVISNGGVFVGFDYPVANTWQKIEITYKVPSTAVNNSTNGVGSRLYVVVGASSTYEGPSELPNWTANGALDYALAGQVDLNTISGASAQITGFQLEVGSVATPFEHRSYGEELALCQRYFLRIGKYEIFGSFYNTTSCILTKDFPVSMRATPTIQYSGSLSSAIDAVALGARTPTSGPNIYSNSGQTNNISMLFTGMASTTQYNPAGWLTSTPLFLDAEL